MVAVRQLRNNKKREEGGGGERKKTFKNLAWFEPANKVTPAPVTLTGTGVGGD